MDTYLETRGRLETYFDRTAARTWEALTSDAPVSRVRRTVREGRDEMRAALLARLPEDLTGARVLDAGAGAGQMAEALARRGAEVVAVDLSASLLDVARRRIPPQIGRRIEFLVGDMLDEALGRFDHVVAMDSLIHYRAADAVAALGRLAGRTSRSLVFTVAPSTPLLRAFWLAGQVFPRGDRSPRIAPVSEAALARLVRRAPALEGFALNRRRRVGRGFYISQAMELAR